MKTDRFVVIDEEYYDVERFSTLASAVKRAKEGAADDAEGAIYYVAEIVGMASSKREPHPVKYTAFGKKK